MSCDDDPRALLLFCERCGGDLVIETFRDRPPAFLCDSARCDAPPLLPVPAAWPEIWHRAASSSIVESEIVP